MLAFVRAGFAAALVLAIVRFRALPPTSPSSATISPTPRSSSKPRSRAEAGQVTKPAATLRREADAAFQRNDFRTGMQILGADRRGRARRQRELAAARQDRPADPPEQRPRAQPRCSSAPRPRPISPISAPAMRARRPRAWSCSRAPLPTASSGARRSMRCGSRSTCARSPRCASNTSACARTTASACSTTSVDADAASPRACFQFSEELPGKRTDFSPFVAVAGHDKPALSVEDKQLCVEGLKHGERYTITLRAGIPSVVKETLPKSADFNIYVRDRKPFVRFTGKAYVLPRTGQRGIPVVSVNTAAVAIEDLPHRRPQPARHRARPRFPAQPRPLRPRPPHRGARRAGLEGRDEGRADAQRRRHHRFPGRSRRSARSRPASM